MRRLWESRWEGKELADLCTPSRKAALSGGPPRGLLLLQWGHSGAVEGTWWGHSGGQLGSLGATVGSRCHLTHQQGCPCKDSVQSITSNICLFSHPAMETPPYINPVK